MVAERRILAYGFLYEVLFSIMAFGLQLTRLKPNHRVQYSEFAAAGRPRQQWAYFKQRISLLILRQIRRRSID